MPHPSDSPRRAALALAVAILLAPCAHAQQAVAPAHAPTASASGLEVRQGPVTLRVVALTDDVLRVTLAPGGAFPEDASWAVPHAVRAQRVQVSPRPK
jgi:alpha-glucosidase